MSLFALKHATAQRRSRRTAMHRRQLPSAAVRVEKVENKGYREIYLREKERGREYREDAAEASSRLSSPGVSRTAAMCLPLCLKHEINTRAHKPRRLRKLSAGFTSSSFFFPSSRRPLSILCLALELFSARAWDI